MSVSHPLCGLGMVTNNEISSARGAGVAAEELPGHRQAAVTSHLLMFSVKLELGELGQDSPGTCWWGQSRTNSPCSLLWVLGGTSTPWQGELCGMGGKRGFVSSAGITKTASRSPESGWASG